MKFKLSKLKDTVFSTIEEKKKKLLDKGYRIIKEREVNNGKAVIVTLAKEE